MERSLGQRRLVDLIECFLTPAPNHARSSLRAFRSGEQHQIEEMDPFTTDPSLLPDGCRVVFSFGPIPSQQPDAGFSSLFLASDRTPLLSEWKPRLYRKLSLPAIYDPTPPFKVLDHVGQSVLHMVPYPQTQSEVLFVATQSEVHAIHLDHWGEEGCLQQDPFQSSFSRLSCMSTGVYSDTLYIVDGGQAMVMNTSSRQLEQAGDVIPQGIPEGKLMGLYELDAQNRIFVFADHELWMDTATGLSKLSLQDPHDGRDLGIDTLSWLADGSLIFRDDSKKSLWYYRLPNSSPIRVFGPVAGPLFYCVDRRGLVYILEQYMSCLHILLPADHWECHVCGGHWAYRPDRAICPWCQALLKKSFHPDWPFHPWISLDLSRFKEPLGPLTIDGDLNLYLVSQERYISVIPFSPRHMWGQEEM